MRFALCGCGCSLDVTRVCVRVSVCVCLAESQKLFWSRDVQLIANQMLFKDKMKTRSLLIQEVQQPWRTQCVGWVWSSVPETVNREKEEERPARPAQEHVDWGPWGPSTWGWGAPEAFSAELWSDETPELVPSHALLCVVNSIASSFSPNLEFSFRCILFDNS